MTRRSPHGLPMLKYQGLRYPRSMGEAFKTPEWSTAIHVYRSPSLWHRILQMLRRRFAS